MTIKQKVGVTHYEIIENISRGVGDEEVVVGEGVVRFSSSFVRSTKSCFGVFWWLILSFRLILFVLVAPAGKRYVVPTGTVIVPTGMYIVPTGRVIVATGMYVVPTGRVIVPTGRYIVLTGRVIVATGRTRRDSDRRIIILPPTTAEEHIAVQRESKARTTLLQSIPDDHVADFHYMDDVKDIWNAVKARFGGNSKSKKMRKSMLKQEFSEFRIGDAEEFALMGVTSERNSSKNLFKLIDSSMSVRTKVGLGFTDCISENELGWDDSAFSVFTTNSEDVEGRPIFHRFAKTDSMKDVPPPLSEDYTSLSDNIDLDESQMSYGTKSSTSCDSKLVSNDFVSCDDSDKSLEVNTNDFASSDSSVKSSEHKPNDSTSCASTSSVFTSVNEAEIESNVGTPIKEPIIVQDLSSFTCNSLDKNENTSRNSCNKNGYVNKKADGQQLLSPQQVVLGKQIEKIYTGYPRRIVDLIHLHTDDNVADLLTKALDGPRYVVPTGRVIVPTGRYIVPTGRVIVATG
nr:xylulose kinase-1 [Tanacetum cinerariifolium]